jgi:hypothetical protein
MGDTLDRLARVIDRGAWIEVNPDLALHRQSGARRKARALLRELRDALNQSGRLLLMARSQAGQSPPSMPGRQ